MHLKEYLNKYGLTPTSFAKKCGIARGTMWHYANAEKVDYRIRTAYMIELATGGEVTLQDMLTEEDKAQIKKRIDSAHH